MTANCPSRNTAKKTYWGTAVLLCLLLALTASAMAERLP